MAARALLLARCRQGGQVRSIAAAVAGQRDVERELVAAAQAQPAAFAPIYRAYLDPVYRYLWLRVRDDETAADLTQQVFLKALQSLPSYRERGLPFAAWLFRIARNQAVDASRRRHDVAALDLLPEIPDPAQSSDLEAAGLRREALVRLRDLVSALDPDERELLALRFAGGLSSREIAPLVGKGEEAVKKQLTRLLRKLRDQYHEA